MTILTQRQMTAEFLVSEANDFRSRTTGAVTAGSSALEPGAILGGVITGTATATAGGSNTGDGTMTVDATTPVIANGQVGTYTATCITAATNGGTFRVTDPKGNVLGDVDVGDTFANQIKFVINDGATDYAVGDTFTVLTTITSIAYELLDLAATDGSQYPAGILWEEVAATETETRTIICRDAEVVADHLTYSASATDAQKVATNAALAQLGIITR